MKNKLNNCCFILLILVLSASTCKKNKNCPDGSHEYLYIKNNSNTKINWVNGDTANDSIWRVQGTPSFDESFSSVSPNSIYNVGAGLIGCWDYHYRSGSPQYYFLFDNDSVRTIGWQVINGTNRGLLKRIKVDLNYLQANNFTITYP